MNHQEARDLALAALARDADIPHDVRDHVATCDACGAFLDHALACERAYEGTPDLSPRALRLMGDDIVARAVAQARTPAKGWRWWTWGLPTFAAAAAAAVLVVVSPPSDGLRPRGLDHGSGGAPARVRLMCVQGSGVSADVFTDRPGPGTLACPQAGILGMAVSVEPGAELKHLFLVGVTPEGQVRWYHPRPEEGTSVSLPPPPVTDHPLSGVKLRVNHAPGTVRVLALFTELPLDVAFVKTHLEQGDLEAALPRGSLAQSVGLVVE